MVLDPTSTIAAAAIVALCILTLSALRAWQGWLDLKRREMERAPAKSVDEIEGGAGVGAARIELADMKERIKKLEAIASGVEL